MSNGGYGGGYDAGFAEGSSQASELKKQLTDIAIKRDIAVDTLEKVKVDRSAAMKALMAQCDETLKLRARVVELEAQLAESQAREAALLAAIKVVEIDSEECLDFDECTAMLVPLDAYTALVEAASDDTALREWGAKLLEKVAREFFSDVDDQLLAVAEMFRSGEWKP